MSAPPESCFAGNKMASGPPPEHRQESAAPADKDGRAECNADSCTSAACGPSVRSEHGDYANLEHGVDVKQEESSKLLTLNEGELRALLDEAITYKCPKDREGKSNLFKKLLQDVEADENEEGRRTVTISRYLPGSNRRRQKRDPVSEPLTHGGSLQNLAQPINSEFENFTYLNSSFSQNCGRRKGRKCPNQPSVSARQREGGSLPSNVNASHTLASLANFDLIFDKKKNFASDKVAYSSSKKESKSVEKPSNHEEKKEEKKDSVTSEASGKHGTNEMVVSALNNAPPEYQKPECMVIDLANVDIAGPLNSSNATPTTSNVELLATHSVDEGTEMKVIEPRGTTQYVSTLDIRQTPVDTAVDASVKFPLHETTGQDNRTRSMLNGSDEVPPVSMQYNNLRMYSCPSNGYGAQQAKNQMPSNVYPYLARATGDVMKVFEAWDAALGECSVSVEKKSLDENGNAVHGYSNERKKTRRKHMQEPNVIVYQSENVEGHRNDVDVDDLVNFIENKGFKSKRGKSNNAVRVKSNPNGSKSRSREKDSKRVQMPNKLHKCNSLEEISKTKLEDLTVEKSMDSNDANNILDATNTPLHHTPKVQCDTWEGSVDGSRGDRRSWGTEEGQFIYCNDTGDEYNTLSNSTNKINLEFEADTEFLVVSKKKKSKKQRRSSSGSRAQQFSNSGSYLQGTREFSTVYRAPLTSELRRKSASSMPSSDKSDSSDLDSVHSLPVTSNSSKHTSSKTSSACSPAQASYADITRMATMNVSADSVLNISNNVNPGLDSNAWPSVNPKASSESSKLSVSNDYYPSLDELQHSSDRKLRQYQFVRSNRSLNYSFDGNSSLLKYKVATENNNKTCNREETITKNIRVFKYVQDVEKIHKSLSKQNGGGPKTAPPNGGGNTNNSNVTQTQSANSGGEVNAVPCNKLADFSSASSSSDENSSLDNNTSSDVIKPPPPPPLPAVEEKKAAAKKCNSQVDEAVRLGKNMNSVKPNPIPKSNASKNTGKGIMKSRKSSLMRPPVILLDEAISDANRGDSSSELTFGFDINELLLNNEKKKTGATESVTSAPVATSEKTNASGDNADISARNVGTSSSSTLSTSTRIDTVPKNTDKCRKEDFSVRFVTPVDGTAVLNYNHDKIVTFVGLAWDDVMREMPVTAASGRVQYYNGQ